MKDELVAEKDSLEHERAGCPYCFDKASAIRPWSFPKLLEYLVRRVQDPMLVGKHQFDL